VTTSEPHFLGNFAVEGVDPVKRKGKTEKTLEGGGDGVACVTSLELKLRDSPKSIKVNAGRKRKSGKSTGLDRPRRHTVSTVLSNNKK